MATLASSSLISPPSQLVSVVREKPSDSEIVLGFTSRTRLTVRSCSLSRLDSLFASCIFIFPRCWSVNPSSSSPFPFFVSPSDVPVARSNLPGPCV